ncbi:MAG: sensor histidine kinase [Romboutsia timonensis]|uniref:HAMP domain-containing sensor histidine kinase n=1 Tax=Romboutsia timonensis TaxID=1776391 RepID=UPI002A76284D|nr:sensor histidine kinase [Romboutsia timonensis]MDY2883843.1 sensor histidine kinase [Romboutsia timonensis]
MRKSKGLKFSYLVVLFVCIATFFSGMITSLRSIGSSSVGTITSYMHDDKKLIESEFYKSRYFDVDNLSHLIYWTTSSVMDEVEKNSFDTDRDRIREQIGDVISNTKYLVINDDTKEYYSNTDYNTPKAFEDNLKGQCDLIIKIKDYRVVNYTKNLEGKIYKNNIDITNRLSRRSEIKDGEIYVSIPKNIDGEDYLNHLKSSFVNTGNLLKTMIIVESSSLILGIVAMILYKTNKSYLFDKDSFWLRLSKFVPLELYLFTIFLAIVLLTQSIDWYYDLLGGFIWCFLSIGYMLTVAYIFNKQINSYDNKLDFFKTTFVYRAYKLIIKLFKETLKLTRSMALAKRIIILAIVCIAVNVFMIIYAIEEYNAFIGILAPIITIAGFTYYMLKKLSYLSYIMDGTQRIKNGDIHHKLQLIGEDNFTTLADNINNIRDGLDKAIDSQLRSERMKSELITNVSHDLKTPLTSIINYVELIKKEENISPEYLKDYINVLDSKSKRLKVLIEDLFEASKASSGNIELNMEKIDLIQLLRQSIGELEEKLSEANLDLKINVPEDKVYVRADGRRLYRVLENLLSNISKYSLPNTRVYIDITEVEGRVKLIMKNISSYELNFDPEEIMERFKRADDSRNTEGSGLGLAIARDLVKLQGGEFAIDIDGDLFKSIIEFDSIK